MPTRSDKKINWFLKRKFFAVRNQEVIYRNVVNIGNRYKGHTVTSLDPKLEKEILRDLETDGISIRRLEEVLPTFDFMELQNWINVNECNLREKNKKKYLQSYYGTEDASKPLDLENPFVRLYLSDELLHIATKYLGYVPQLYEVYIEKTLPIGDNSPTFSQNWHRDPEEKRTLKIFLYMSDVNLDSGPFTYIKGSAPTSNGDYAKLFKQDLPLGSYPLEGDVSKAVRSEDMLVATAKKGTVIFCDTAGLHKGGHAKSDARIMSTAFFPSKKWSEPRLFKVDKSKSGYLELSDLARRVLD